MRTALVYNPFSGTVNCIIIQPSENTEKFVSSDIVRRVSAITHSPRRRPAASESVGLTLRENLAARWQSV